MKHEVHWIQLNSGVTMRCSVYEETDEARYLLCFGRSWTLRTQHVTRESTGSAFISWRDPRPCMKTSWSRCQTSSWSWSSTCTIIVPLNYFAPATTTDFSVRRVPNLCSIKIWFPCIFMFIINCSWKRVNDISASNWYGITPRILPLILVNIRGTP
jgi:hypothetical protein